MGRKKKYMRLIREEGRKIRYVEYNEYLKNKKYWSRNYEEDKIVKL